MQNVSRARSTVVEYFLEKIFFRKSATTRLFYLNFMSN